MEGETPVSCIAGLDIYQTEAFKTAVFPPEIGPIYCAMGILGEAGEMGKVLLDVIERAVEENPDFGTPDLHLIKTTLRRAVDACADLEILKKQARKGKMGLAPMPGLTDAEKDRVRSELGDELWYAGAMATMTGTKLSQIAQRNIAKLRERRDAGLIASAGETIEERRAYEEKKPELSDPHCFPEH